MSGQAPADVYAVDASVAVVTVEAGPPVPRIGQPFFLDGGGQAELCEEGSPPLALDPKRSNHACWYAGSSCEGRGTQITGPFALAGNVLSGFTTHGGCDLGKYALVYEKGTSPLRVRVCESRPPPVDCPAMVHDGAEWDLGPLLEASHATRAILLKP
jgi:hypothetical protein